MDLLKPIDWADAANKSDVDRLAGEVDRLASEVDHLAAATKSDVHRLARDIDRVAITTTRDLEAFTAEIRAAIAESVRGMQRKILLWTFMIVLAAVVAGIGISVAVARSV